MFSFLFLDSHMLHAVDTIELSDGLYFEELLRRLGLPALGSYRIRPTWNKTPIQDTRKITFHGYASEF